MASPSALVLFVTNTVASTASRTHVRDDRETPLWVARDGRQSAGDFRDGSIADACDQLARRANQYSCSRNPTSEVKIVGSDCEAARYCLPTMLPPISKRTYLFDAGTFDAETTGDGNTNNLSNSSPVTGA
jgi:hypothetical protein